MGPPPYLASWRAYDPPLCLLSDVRAHFRASLETSEYENTSNLFHVTAAEQTAALLARCEILLAAASSASGSGSGLELGSGLGCADEQAAANHRSSLVDCVDSKVGAETGPSGYLEMLASPSPSKSSRECWTLLIHITYSHASVTEIQINHAKVYW